MCSFCLHTWMWVIAWSPCVLCIAGPGDNGVTVRTQEHMGTYVTITVATPESPEVLRAIDAGFSEVDRLEVVLSEWREDSEIAKVNHRAGFEPARICPELFQVIQMAHEVSVASEGAFDVSFAALNGLWKYNAKNPRIPTKEEVQKRLRFVDYRNVLLDATGHSILLKKEGMRIGVGGIAKGYVVDRVSAVLKERGFSNHLVDAGGDLYASGKRGDRGWRIGVRDPKGRGLYAVVSLQDEGMATSGNYEKYFIKGGVRYHHLLDPKTGFPARGTTSVTVIAESAAEADAYATASFVMGKEKALAMAYKKGLEVFIIDADFNTYATHLMSIRIQPIGRQL
jgi:thiamine biosynthesis lipoprotein